MAGTGRPLGRLALTACAVVCLAATPAQARFGKRGSSSGSGSSSSSSSSNSGESTSRSFGGGNSSSSTSSAPDYHPAVPVGSSAGGGGSAYGAGHWSGPGSMAARPFRHRLYFSGGYYSGAFIPWYGYGYGYYAPVAAPLVVAPEPSVQPEPAAELRTVAALEANVYVGSEAGGGALTLSAMFEGERWGFFVSGQQATLPSKDVPGETDKLHQLSLQATYAFLTGRHGRLRANFGADAVFAADLVVAGPTGGLSGTLWLIGPLALEGSAVVTPLPFLQLDGRANLAIGVGALGFRLGWRTQLLDDRGLVDGIAHRDVFNGPFGGVAYVF